MVNTFIGDGLFASFNMPLACPDHACAAVQAAIDIQRAVGSRTFGDLGVALATRVGISTGTVIGGSVGAGQRMSYTLLGDTVNLAARLEALNKDHGTRILVSQSTRDACGERFAFASLGTVAVRGRSETDRRLQPRSQPSGNPVMNASGLSPEQVKLQARARELAAGPVAARAAEVDRTEQYPWDNVELLKDAKLIGMTIPTQYGGQGKNWLDAVLAIEALSAACAVTGRIAVETNMGAISAVMAYGSEEQKKMAADMVLAGDKPAICITEPEAGSDADGMTTRADKKGNRYVINGRKHWITGGGVSRLHLIFAKVYDEQGNEEGIGGFLAIRDETKGLKITKREPTMGLRGIPEAVIDFEDMDVPPSSLVIPPRGLKKGFADLMTAYNSQRVGAATVALGIAEGAYQLALDWSEKRQQFGRPINEFQGLQWKLADMSIKLSAARRWSTTPRAPAKAASPTCCWPRRPRSSPRRARSRWSTTRCSSSARAATAASCRSNAWRATSACSRSAAARPRCCATSWPVRCSRRSCRRRATAGSGTEPGRGEPDDNGQGNPSEVTAARCPGIAYRGQSEGDDAHGDDPLTGRVRVEAGRGDQQDREGHPRHRAALPHEPYQQSESLRFDTDARKDLRLRDHPVNERRNQRQHAGRLDEESTHRDSSIQQCMDRISARPRAVNTVVYGSWPTLDWDRKNGCARG